MLERAVAVLLLLSLLLLPSTRAAAEPSVADPADVETFVDGAAAALLNAGDAPGMTVSVVKDGRVVFAKGYGFASLKSRTPVSADRTLFRIGSVSKLFLATAIMQLVEQGLVDLDTNVNQYLEGVRVPEAFGQHITLSHLMTHTAGFEEASFGRTWAPSAEAVPPLRDVLAGYLPQRVRPPGTIAAYSNHGTALAALVVEQVSGEPFDVYLERHIFTPLGMTRTTSRQPIPEALDAELSTGAAGEDFFAYVKIPPAGSISSTASDMTKFMLAHLQLGRLGKARILKEETVRRMHGQLFTHDSRVNGFAHQFFELDVNGHRGLGHGGGTLRHTTMFVLVPEEGIGFFASVNAQSPASGTLSQLFFDRYLPPASAPNLEPVEGAAERLPRYAGFYAESRTNETSPTRLSGYLTMQRARAGKDGHLVFLGKEWIETELGLFRRIDGKDWLVFREENGQIIHAFRGNGSHSVLIRQPWWQRRDVQVVFPVLAFLVLIHPFFYRPVDSFRAWRRAVEEGGRRATARLTSAALRTLALVFSMSFGVGTAISLRAPTDALSFWWRIAFSVAYLIPPLAIALTSVAALAWVKNEGRARARVGLALTALAGLLVTGWLSHWNLFLHRV